MNKTTIVGNYDVINIDGVDYRVADIKNLQPVPNPNRPGFLKGRQLRVGSRLQKYGGRYIVAQTTSGRAQLINITGDAGNSWSFKSSAHHRGDVQDDNMFCDSKHEFIWEDES